jgi:hypothetical protein
MEALIQVAKHGGPTVLPRIGAMRELNRLCQSQFCQSSTFRLARLLIL